MRVVPHLLIAVGLLALAPGAATIVPASPPLQTPEAPEAPPVDPNRIFLDRAQLSEALSTGALDREVKSLLNVAGPLRHGEFEWNDRNVPAGPVWVRVDLGSQIISVFRAGHEIGTAVILFGADDKETPTGVFPVMWKRKDHHSSTYDAPMPYTLRLTEDGVAIHGSDVRWGRATHGCVGVPLEFARLMYDQVSASDQVVIVRQQPVARS